MKTPVNLLAALSLAAVSTLGATGCVIRETRGAYTTRTSVAATTTVAVGNPGYVYVQTLPPDPLYETITPAPYYGSVWIDGYWHWNGYEWIWMGGHWEAPHDGYVYIQPYYDYSNGYYVYNPGYWEHRSHVPGTVVVREHGDGRPPTGYHPNQTTHVTVTPTGTNNGNTVVVRPAGNGDPNHIVINPGQNTGGNDGGTVVVTNPPGRNPHLDEGINQNPDGPVRMPDRDHGKPAVVVTEPARTTTPVVTQPAPVITQPARATTPSPTVVVSPPTRPVAPTRPADPPRTVSPVHVNTNQDPPPRQVNPTVGGGVRVNPAPVTPAPTRTVTPAAPVRPASPAPARTVTPAAPARPAATPAVQPAPARPAQPVKPAAPAKPTNVKVRSR